MPETKSVALVRFRVPDSPEILRCRYELAELRRVLLQREQHLGELRAQLVSFEGRYLRQVGILYRRLDEWERKIAELRGKVETPVEDTGEAAWVGGATGEDAADFDPGALRALFRELVKLLHPDFATGAEDERRRTDLMALANDAYAREDAAAIRRMLRGYDSVPLLTSAEGVRNEVARLMTRMLEVKQDVDAVNLQIDELHESPSAQLQERALAAAREGRDLLAEMAARVNGSIGLAMRRYELDLSQKQRPSKGLPVEALLSAEIRGR